MKLLSFVVFFLQSISIETIYMNMNLVRDYLKFNKISISLFMTCDDGVATEKVQNMIEMQNIDVWSHFLDISNETEVHNFNYKDVLVRKSTPICIAVDLDCDNAIDVMEEISRRKMFHFERFWLMFGNDWNQSYQMLQHQFINMDAEIYLALTTNKT